MSVFKTFFGLVVLLLSFFQLSAFQQDEPRIRWYERFFDQRKQPGDKELEQKKSLLDEARIARDLHKESKLLQEVGLINLTRVHDYSLAMDNFIRAVTIQDSLGLKQDLVFTYIAIADLFREIGDPVKSAHFLERASVLNESFNDMGVTVFILNKLGKVNASGGRLEEAFENYQHVLHHLESMHDSGMEAETLFNIGSLYALQTNYSEALDSYKRALTIWRAMGDKNREARALNDIAELYRLMKNNDKALANHVVALEIRQALKDKNGLAQSYNNIGALYLQQKNYERSIANVRLGLEAAQESQSHVELVKSYDLLNNCYKALGDYKNALTYKELGLAMLEMIHGENNDKKVLETQTRYEIEKKEAQVEKLELIRKEREREIQEAEKFRNILFIILGLGVIIALLIFYLYLMKRRSTRILQAANRKVQEQNSQLQELNATKDKFFSIISHDLKGPLNSLTSFSGLLINHLDSLSKEEIQMLAKDLDKSVKNLFALLENLLEWSRSQTGNIEFKPVSFSLVHVLSENKSLLQAQAQNKNISIVYNPTGDIVVNAHRNSVNTVVRNLISNAIKFTPADGSITLSTSQRDNEIIVSIADTGVGMSKEIIDKLFRIDTKYTTKGTAEEKGTGLGLILCKEFIEKNGGRIWVESEPGKGSVFSFSLPYAPVAQPAEVVN